MAYFYFLANTYGSGNYGADTYQHGTTTTTTVGVPANGGGSLLTNTGFDTSLAMLAAGLIVLGALVIKFWKSRAKAGADVKVD